MDIIYRDADFTNAMLFGTYIMVLMDGKMIGGGLVEEFDEIEVKVGQGRFLRNSSTFVLAPPPQCPTNM
ncbi:hypothetical protein ASG89_34550 [Paenibacillus sp. Soil766]|uniref:hypothetical protein n=1 Tax=Paenibacillus sp. Soil766 TaxID=1736404 RepID=UPI00070C5BDA|nr:hypothetical protein [Paenibacillus sp. Soil766]KRE90745.1 hypothetical protein ASG89_34550 [Paenibacillus sp. Soil766]